MMVDKDQISACELACEGVYGEVEKAEHCQATVV